jgi:hypothetical protein
MSAVSKPAREKTWVQNEDVSESDECGLVRKYFSPDEAAAIRQLEITIQKQRERV